MAETNLTPEEIKVQGVRKSIIEERLNIYRRKVYGLTENDVKDLEEQLESAMAMEVRAQGRLEDDPENESKRAQYETIQRRVKELAVAVKEAKENVGKTSVEENSVDYYRMIDVIPELEDILANADPNLEYIPIEEIQRRLAAQRNLKAELEAAQRAGTTGLSEEEIAEIEARIAALTVEMNEYARLRENDEQAREALEKERQELEDRIAEITAALENNGEGDRKEPLSDEERQELEDRLSGAKSALNAERTTREAKLRELNELKRQRDAEIARINSENTTREVLFSGIDDTHDSEAEKARLAQELNIDPSELEIVSDGANNYGDNVAAEFDIVRVKKENQLLTVDERAAIEREIKEAEDRIAEIDNELDNELDIDLDKIKAVLKENLKAEIEDYKQRIRINNELYAGSRDEENKDLEAKGKDVEARLAAVDTLTAEQMLAEIDLQITYLRDSIVRNNETYANSERRHEANEALRAKSKVIDGFQKEINEAKAKKEKETQENEVDLDKIKAVLKENLKAEIEDYKQRIRINNELYAGSRDEENKDLEAKGKDVEARLAAVDTLTAEQMLAEIDLQITYLRDSIVRNNETYANSERRHEANEALRAKIKELEGFKKELSKPTKQNNSQEKDELKARIAELRDRLSKDDALRAKYPRLAELDAQIGVREAELEEIENTIKELEAEVAEYEKQIEEDDKARNVQKELSPEEKEKLEKELKEKQDRLAEVKDALENPDKAKDYYTKQEERINLIIIDLTVKIRKGREQRGQEGVDNSEAIRIADNKIKELEELEILKEEFTIKKDPIQKGDPIPIPPIPQVDPKLDEEKIKNEYLRRKHDMYAKYYGDKDYQEKYDEVAKRYRGHERDVVLEGDVTYRTVEDYAGRLEDEKFLLLEGYKDALERMTKDQAGIEVYRGTPEEIEAQRAKDKEYVETRNHTFDQHKYTHKDLATLGKYGEKMPYIPQQDGMLRNIGRGILNVGIFARNVVAPVYRFIGKNIAQPFHRLVTGGKDASPYRNNFYHRMVARREYFAEQGRLRDEAETRELMEQAEPGEDVKPVRHPVRNWAAARWNAIFKSKEGNEAVLNAGEHDIKENIVKQERNAALVKALEENREKMAKEIQELKEALDKNPNAPNAEEVKQAIEDRQAKIDNLALSINDVKAAREETKQTDAVSDKTHAIARKEINTFRTTVIKGVVKGALVKYVGPAVHKWILEHSKIKTREWVDPTTKQEWVDETTKQEWVDSTTKQEWVDGTYQDRIEPVFEEGFPQGTPRELIGERAGTTYTGWRTVSGGHRNPASYTLTGNEKITGVWVDNGTRWGTGVSDSAGLTAPVLTDRLVDAGLMTPAGTFRNDVEWSEILRVCKMEGIDVDKVYVSVGDRHWAKAADIFGTEQVQVGENVIKDFIPGHWDTVTVPGHWDTVTVPGHWDTVTVPGYWKDVIKDNPRIAGFLNGGKVVARGAIVADGIHDVAENLRNTHTDVPEHKPQPRHYDGKMEVTDIDVEGIFGDEAHPTSKYEYEQRRKDEEMEL